MSLVETENAHLPYGYTIVPGDEIDARDVLEVREQRQREFDKAIPKWIRCLRDSITVVGVGMTDGPDRVVGVGFLAGNPRHGELCDLTVHPRHRHQGLARFLISERVRFADQNDIDYLLVDLAPDNPLESFYRELGFTGLGRTLHRNHPSLER